MNRSPFDYHQHQQPSAASTPGEGPYRRAALFEFKLPEHLPTSPMCPAHPKNKSKGKGVCVVCISGFIPSLACSFFGFFGLFMARRCYSQVLVVVY